LLRKADYEAWLNEPTTFILIAEQEEISLGYAFVRVKEGNSATWQCAADKIAEIETLSVLPEFRGLRVGSKLMERIYIELKKIGVKELSLVVLTSNPKAIEFYERQGFTQRLVSLGKYIPG